MAGAGGRLAVTLTGIATLLVIVRFLGAEGRGEYFLFLTLLALLTTLADCGASQGLAAHAVRVTSPSSERPRPLPRLVPLALALSAAALTIAAPTYWMLGPRLVPNVSEWTIGLVAVTLPVNLYVSLWAYSMVGQRRIIALNAVLAAGAVLSLGFHSALLVLYAGRPDAAMAAMGAYGVSMGAQALIMGIVTSRGQVNGHRTPLADQWREVLSFGIRVYPGAIATLAWTRLPVLLLNIFHGPAAVGYFAVAQQVAEKATLPAGAAQDAVYSIVSTLPRQQAREAMNRYVRVGMWGMAALVLPVGIAAPWVAMLAFGGDSEAAARTASVLRVLLVGTPFLAGGMIVSSYFLGQLRRPGTLSFLSILNVAATCLLGLVLIPIWTELGAAAALAAQQCIGAVVILALYVRLTGASAGALVIMRAADARELLRTVRFFR